MLRLTVSRAEFSCVAFRWCQKRIHVSRLSQLQIWLLICAAVALAQNDGRYRPAPRPISALSTRVAANAGRYRGGNDGRYVPGDDGKYRGGNDGRYGGNNDGRYVHVDNKYQHDNRPGGDYTGGNDPYRGGKDKFGAGGGAGRGGGGGGGGGAANAANGANANGRAGAGAAAGAGAGAGAAKKPSLPRPVPVVDQRPNLPQGRGTGVGKNGWLILRQEGAVDTDGYNYL